MPMNETKTEQMHAARMIHVLDVREGDLIDTAGMWGPDMETEALAEQELAEVYNLEEVEEGWVWIHFSNICPISWDLTEPIVVQRRFNNA